MRLRFSLKSLVVLVSFAAVLFGWWSDHWRLRQRIGELEELEEFEEAPAIIAIQSGQMVAPLSPPSGMGRFRPDNVDAPDQASVNVEISE